VRRGRYSIAIRTQAILEAKAKEANDNATRTIKKQRLDDTFVEEMTSLDTDGFNFENFDGLLDLSRKFP